ncbi:MAG: PLP-dependent aminotransferase family protein [Geminicoccaceae bacterium]
MTAPLPLELDRSARAPLAEQIRKGISAAIESGVLAPGARLPSWLDLAAQLGVARGTVRSAYERLAGAQLIVASRAAGTRVADRPASAVRLELPEPGSIIEMYRSPTARSAIFQMGVPAREAFPAKLLTRIRSAALRSEASAPAIYPDPRGEPALRREIAAYLAVARGVECSPAQIVVTAGFSAGLGLALRALGLEGHKAWMEDPGFPPTRRGLALARLSPVPVPVDADGIDVEYGLGHASDAALVLVTPGQQAPLGSTLALARRLRLLEWAARAEAWVIEDDYLSELQLRARAAPALASLDRAGRVIHIGSFSKTISPTLRLGFIVAPVTLASRFAETAACLAPAPGPSVQLATAEFMREGHYLRLLRRLTRLYSAPRAALLECLRARGREVEIAGLAAVLRLPQEVSDLAVAKELTGVGLTPAPLSPWYATTAAARSGLLLGIATAPREQLAAACDRLCEVVERFTR